MQAGFQNEGVKKKKDEGGGKKKKKEPWSFDENERGIPAVKRCVALPFLRVVINMQLIHQSHQTLAERIKLDGQKGRRRASRCRCWQSDRRWSSARLITEPPSLFGGGSK